MSRRLLLSYLAITAFVLVVLEVPLGVTFARREQAQLLAGVRHDAAAIAVYAAGPLSTGQVGGLAAVAEAYEEQTGGRVVVVDRNGVAVVDSARADGAGRSFASRPEVASALSGREAQGFRFSRSLGERLLFLAVPVNPGGGVIGATRVTYPAGVLDDRVRRTWVVLAAVGVLILGVVALVSMVLAQSVTRPLREIEEAAARLGHGELSARAPVPAGPRELRLLAEELNATGAKLERLIDAQQRFVADASHQLRTPLAALRLRLEVLEGEVPEAGREDAAAALDEVHRLSRLVEGLLALARAEQEPSRPQPVDVAEVLRRRRAVWEPLAAERAVRLEVDLPSDERLVALMTPGHLDQVLDNLAANALDVSPPGGAVRLVASRAGDSVRVDVVDQGPGMAAEQRARAFDRFWRGPGAVAGTGFGIGLPIAHQLVEADGGSMELLEAPGGGLDVRIVLRRAPKEEGRPFAPLGAATDVP